MKHKPKTLLSSLVDVNVQLVSTDKILFAQSTADCEGQPRCHLAPNEGHLGTKTKLACGFWGC